MKNEKRNFFISYNSKKDEQWATWIAGTLEKGGYTTIIQAWDFLAGENFIINMHKALINGERFIAVLSKAYLSSLYCQAEWANAFTKDPSLEQALFIPVRIEDMKPEGLLTAATYIDLYGKNEEEAEKELLDGVSTKDRPRNRPSFPGGKKIKFPGELPFHNLPKRNPHFTGREDILENIHEIFKKKDAIALTQTLTGLGGIGKTQIAIEYAYVYGYEYDGIRFINAYDNDTVYSSFENFALAYKLIDKNEKYDSAVILEAVHNWMQQHDNWLFIFDNAENDETLSKYLPKQSLGRRHVLITSRYTKWGRLATVILIKVFSPEEAASFLTHRTGLIRDSFQDKLAKTLGYLALALEHAAAYILENKSSYKEYFSLLDEFGLDVFPEDATDATYKSILHATWEISFRKIENESSKQLLNIYAFLDPDNIQKEWFPKASEFLPGPLKEAVINRLEYNKAIAELTKYSLVNLNDKGISLHRLVQEVVRDSIKEEETTWRTCGIHILDEQQYWDFGTAESRSKFSGLVPHILSVTEKIKDETKEVANLYSFLGFGFNELGNYPQALAWYQKALAIREKVSGTDHPDTANTYNNMALVYDNLGDYPQALAWYQKDLAISEKVLGTNHPATATTYNNIGLVYRNLGDYAQALEWLQKALAIREKVLGTDHPDTSVTYNNIGAVYYIQGDYLQALEQYQKALAIDEKVFGTDHLNTALVYNNIANVYSNLGDYPQALAWHQKALAIREKVLGKDHPDTAIAYNNIGSVYDTLGDYPQALAWHQKALAIREKVLGTDHPDTATTYNNIGSVHDNLGDYPQALEYYQKALAIKEKILGTDHPATATSYNNIGSVYYNLGDYPQALAWYQKAFAIVEKILGKDHPNTRTTYNNMIIAYAATKNPQPFEDWLREHFVS